MHLEKSSWMAFGVCLLQQFGQSKDIKLWTFCVQFCRFDTASIFGCWTACRALKLQQITVCNFIICRSLIICRRPSNFLLNAHTLILNAGRLAAACSKHCCCCCSVHWCLQSVLWLLPPSKREINIHALFVVRSSWTTVFSNVCCIFFAYVLLRGITIGLHSFEVPTADWAM